MNSMKYCMTLMIVLCNSIIFAQNTDEQFSKARQEAFKGQRTQARELLVAILEKNPNYHDARILLARTFAWDQQREEARKHLRIVLEKSPTNQDALDALIDVERWDERYADALTVCSFAISNYPNNENFIYKKSLTEKDLGKTNAAIITLNHLLSLNPAHGDALKLLRTLKNENLKYTAAIGYSIDGFSRIYDPAHYANVQISRINTWGSAFLRLNYANRFSTQGFQPEVDLYPALAKGVYAYVNYGYSSSELFPKHRYGGEIFSRLPANLEASAGMRYLYFNNNTQVPIITGSLGVYVKSYWFSLRPYITPDKATGTGMSATVFMKKYFNSRDQYLGLSAGLGFSPDERRFQTGSGFSSDGIYTLRSQRLSISSYKEIGGNFILTANIDYTRQELLFDVGNYVRITSFGIGLKKRL